MNVWDDITGIFGSTPTPGGSNVPAASGTSNFFSNLLSGAERGAAQTFAGSSVGQQLSGFLVQGQSQLAAQNLFGNPLVLIGGVVLIGIAVFALARR